MSTYIVTAPGVTENTPEVRPADIGAFRTEFSALIETAFNGELADSSLMALANKSISIPVGRDSVQINLMGQSGLRARPVSAQGTTLKGQSINRGTKTFRIEQPVVITYHDDDYNKMLDPLDSSMKTQRATEIARAFKYNATAKIGTLLMKGAMDATPALSDFNGGILLEASANYDTAATAVIADLTALKEEMVFRNKNARRELVFVVKSSTYNLLTTTDNPLINKETSGVSFGGVQVDSKISLGGTPIIRDDFFTSLCMDLSDDTAISTADAKYLLGLDPNYDTPTAEELEVAFGAKYRGDFTDVRALCFNPAKAVAYMKNKEWEVKYDWIPGQDVWQTLAKLVHGAYIIRPDACGALVANGSTLIAP